MRLVPTDIVTEALRSGAYAGHLVRIITVSDHVLRVCTFDEDFQYTDPTLSYGLETFAACDLSVPDIGFDGTIARGSQLEWGDQTLAVWIGSLYREFDEAQVTIYLAFLDVPLQAFQLWSGRAGKTVRKVSDKAGASATMTLDAEGGTLYAPRQRIQDVVEQKWLLAAGTVLIVNGQPWRIERPKSINT